MAGYAKGIIRDVFLQWDTDGSGCIEKEELAHVLTRLGNFTDDDVDRIMVEVDRNGDGLIQYDEFVDWLLNPSVTVGAAALLSTAELHMRAEEEALASDEPLAEEEVHKWMFGSPAARPVKLPAPLSLQLEHTIVIWVQMQAVQGDWAQLIGDTSLGWKYSIGVSKSGQLGMADPRVGNDALCAEGKHEVPENSWAMVAVRGMCSTSSSSPNGNSEFLVAHNESCIRNLGSVSGTGSGLVIGEFGDTDGAIQAIASVAIWSRLMADSELKELFLWDGLKYGCVTAEERDWLKLNRRQRPTRDEDEEAEFARRLEEAYGGKSMALDFSSLKIVDDDLPKIIVALEASWSTSALILSDNYITEDGVKDHLVSVLHLLTDTFRMDLSRNLDINRNAEQPLISAMEKIPKEWGCCVDLRGTGVPGATAVDLLNQSQQAQEVACSIAQERQRTATMCQAYEESQASLQEKWAGETQALIPFPSSGPLPLVDSAKYGTDGQDLKDVTSAFNMLIRTNGLKDLAPGVMLSAALGVNAINGASFELEKCGNSTRLPDDGQAKDISEFFGKCSEEAAHKEVKQIIDEQVPFGKFPLGDPKKLQDVRVYLSTIAGALYDHCESPKFAWSKVGGHGLPENCGSGQLIAHLSYLCCSMRPKPHVDFGFRLREKGESVESRMVEPGAVGLHSSVESGTVKLKAASGKSFGHHAVALTLFNASAKPVKVAIPAGAIFSHVTWVHRQNLLVGKTVHVELAPGETKEHKVGAHCMNLTCCCSAGDSMVLTAFLLRDAKILKSQGMVWDYFEGIFTKFREEAGFKEGGKRKGKKGKK